jgi:hypothetical protein
MIVISCPPVVVMRPVPVSSKSSSSSPPPRQCSDSLHSPVTHKTVYHHLPVSGRRAWHTSELFAFAVSRSCLSAFSSHSSSSSSIFQSNAIEVIFSSLVETDHVRSQAGQRLQARRQGLSFARIDGSTHITSLPSMSKARRSPSTRMHRRRRHWRRSWSSSPVNIVVTVFNC